MTALVSESLTSAQTADTGAVDDAARAFAARAREQDALVYSVIRNPAAVIVIFLVMVVVIGGNWSITNALAHAVMTTGLIAFTVVNIAALWAFRTFGSDSFWHNMIDRIEAVVLGVASVLAARYVTNAHVVVIMGLAVFALHSAISPIQRWFYQGYFIVVPVVCAWALQQRQAPTRDIAIVLASGVGLFCIHRAIQGYTVRHTKFLVQRELLACAASEQQERDRIARDLHDTVMAQLLHLQTIANNQPIDGDRTAFVDEVARLSRIATRDVYASVAKLSSQIPVTSKLRALEQECLQMCRNAAIACDYIASSPDLELLSRDDCDNLRGILLEALSNVMRHSTAQHVRIMICNSADEVLHVYATVDAAASEPKPASESAATAAATSAPGLGLGQQSLRDRARALACDVSHDYGPDFTELRLRRSTANAMPN